MEKEIKSAAQIEAQKPSPKYGVNYVAAVSNSRRKRVENLVYPAIIEAIEDLKLKPEPKDRKYDLK